MDWERLSFSFHQRSLNMAHLNPCIFFLGINTIFYQVLPIIDQFTDYMLTINFKIKKTVSDLDILMVLIMDFLFSSFVGYLR